MGPGITTLPLLSWPCLLDVRQDLADGTPDAGPDDKAKDDSGQVELHESKGGKEEAEEAEEEEEDGSKPYKKHHPRTKRH